MKDRLLFILFSFPIAGFASPHALRWIVQSPNAFESRCVTVESEESLSAWMTREKIQAKVSSEGSVCKIGNVGCDPSACFCECGLWGCHYWALFTKKQNEAWRYAKKGAQNLRPSEYEAVAWIWVQGNMKTTDAQPPHLDRKDTCR